MWRKLANSQNVRVVTLAFLAVALAVVWPFDRIRWPADAPPTNCGSPMTYVSASADWGRATAWETRDDLLASGDSVGLYTIDSRGEKVPLLLLNRAGDISGAESFEIVDPKADFAGKELENIRRVQSYLAGDQTIGGVLNPANPQAIQIAIWAMLGQLNHPGDLNPKTIGETSQYGADWKKYIDKVIDDLKYAKMDGYKPFPFWIGANLDSTQRYGWIGVRALVQDVMANRLQGVQLTLSTAGSTKVVTTDKKGIIETEIRDPAPGHGQLIAVTWRGSIPAGTILKASYKKELENERTRAYLLTTSPVAADLTKDLRFSPGGCA